MYNLIYLSFKVIVFVNKQVIYFTHLLTCIQFKIISIMHNLLHKSKPTYWHNLINIKPTGKARSSLQLCLSLLPLTSKLKVSDCSFHNSSTHLWNILLTYLRSFLQLQPSSTLAFSYFSSIQLTLCLVINFSLT